jgi:ketosteroid isomerase-like protein
MNNPNWVTELFDSIDSMDTNKFVSFLAEDATFTFGNSPSAIGKEIVFQVVDGFFKSIKAISHTDIQTFVDGDFVIARGNSTYTRHDASALTVGFCNVFKMQNSLIQDYKIYIDLSQLYI